MNVRLANINDLDYLIDMYKHVAINMMNNGVYIWNEKFPGNVIELAISDSIFYVLEDNDIIVAGFTLFNKTTTDQDIQWIDNNDKAIYFGRFAINVNYLNSGYGRVCVDKAKRIVNNKGYHYMRLFVVDTNKPALDFYEHLGFNKAKGIYVDKVSDDMIYNEFGYEIECL